MSIYNFIISEGSRAFFTVIDIIILLYIWNKTKSSVLYANSGKENGQLKFALLMFIFCIFSMWAADWYHYLEEFEHVKHYGGEHINLEPVYIWLIENICSNIIQFRVIIWGAAVLLLYKLFRRVSLPTELLVCVFCGIWLIWFSYARASLAMILIYFGFSLCYKPVFSSKSISMIVGICVMALSFFFHKSASFGIAMCLLALITDRLGRKTTTLFLLIIPVVIILARGFIVNFLSMDFDSTGSELEANLAAGQRNFGELSNYSRGIGTIIRDIFELTVYYAVAYMCFKFNQKGFSHDGIPIELNAFTKLTFFIILFASIFAFNLGFDTTTIYRRFMLYSCVPCAISLAFFHHYQMFPKLTKIVIKFGLIGMFYTIFYSLYRTLLHLL